MAKIVDRQGSMVEDIVFMYILTCIFKYVWVYLCTYKYPYLFIYIYMYIY
jgi:hypothetical protein